MVNYLLVVMASLKRTRNISVQLVSSGGEKCIYFGSPLSYATDNFISVCPLNFSLCKIHVYLFKSSKMSAILGSEATGFFLPLHILLSLWCKVYKFYPCAPKSGLNFAR